MASCSTAELAQSLVKNNSANIITDADGIECFKQYVFLGELGRGSFAVVKKVRAIDTMETFAMKCVDRKKLRRIRTSRNGTAYDSIQTEMQIWKGLRHEHIVQLKEVVDDDMNDCLYMVCEYMNGGCALSEDLGQTFEEHTLKRYFSHLMKGVKYLHMKNIVHRDIKPSNLLLSSDGYDTLLKISDFGVARKLSSDEELLRQTIGTPFFHAPEMLSGEGFLGKPTDIWACGVTLYMFLYGRTPYQAEEIAQLHQHILHDDVEYPPQINGIEVNEDAIDLLQKMLEKDPKARLTVLDVLGHRFTQ